MACCSILLLLSSCAHYQLYEGSKKPVSEIAQLDPQASNGGSAVLVIDGEFGPLTGNYYGFSVAQGHVAGVDILPGHHSLVVGVPEGRMLFKTRIYKGEVEMKAGGSYSIDREKGIPDCLKIIEKMNGAETPVGKACACPRLDSLVASVQSKPDKEVARLIWDPGFFANTPWAKAWPWVYEVNSAWGAGGPFFRANEENRFDYRLPPGPVKIVVGGNIDGEYLINPITVTGNLEAGKSYTFKPFKVTRTTGPNLGGIEMDIVPIPENNGKRE